MRRVAALLMLGLGMVPVPPAHSQEIDPIGAVTLVAAPRLIDPDYRGAVLLAVPVENNRHVGVIINRPTGRSLASLFPEHSPSKLVRDPVYFGGPMLRHRSAPNGPALVGCPPLRCASTAAGPMRKRHTTARTNRHMRVI